jgi:hypothetical protein
VEVGDQASTRGSYRPPVLRLEPPHTIILLPVQREVWLDRLEGAVEVEVGVQESAAGS